MKYKHIASYGLLVASIGMGSNTRAQERPVDPFDYNFCGGERVYPVVGVNFSTACGPRNQVALGRRGKLMWYFPATKDKPAEKGAVKLTDKQLAKLSLMAEVVQLADAPEGARGEVLFKMGVNFTGRPYKRFKAVLEDRYTPANELLRMMLGMTRGTPALPGCDGHALAGVFDPTKNLQQRRDALHPVTEN